MNIRLWAVLLGCIGCSGVLLSLWLAQPNQLRETAALVSHRQPQDKPISEPPASSVEPSTAHAGPELMSLHPIRVEVTGRDAIWHFRYPGADGEFRTSDDVCLAEELHLPEDSDVVLFITSDDFLYTWLVPQLKLRKIAVPELTHPLEFRTAAPATFDLPVDPMCGRRLFHDGPMGKMVIQSRAEFVAWLAAVR